MELYIRDISSLVGDFLPIVQPAYRCTFLLKQEWTPLDHLQKSNGKPYRVADKKYYAQMQCCSALIGIITNQPDSPDKVPLLDLIHHKAVKSYEQLPPYAMVILSI
jgi:hypothetical protein